MNQTDQFAALKATANTLPSFRNESRNGLREEIRAALDARSEIQGADRSFIANYKMSQYGYGGGF